HIGPIDSALPKKRILSAQDPVEAARKQVAGRDRCKLSLAIKKSPGLPAGRAESFPVMGNFRLRATSYLNHPAEREIPRVDFASSLGPRTFIVAASCASDVGALAASRSNSSGVRYPNAECSRWRL